ncbi:YadA C-terminal domain-containing protein [uncultured Dialister sp.]|uniref:YadA C-terminal domain-containing protein n=2 Tax=Dialister TaxID=39948 RepID=UPI0026DED8AA|nr:YadA-like family protein [uncultured Dialister sp.]
MKLSGKKLTTAILAGLMGATMFGGSVFAEVSDQEFIEVRQGVNSNKARISQLENAQSTAKDYSTDIAANKKAIGDEAAARESGDNALYNQINKESANQNVTSESDLIKKDQSVGQNLTNVDTALHKEIAARIGADKAQDKVIQTVNSNLANSVDTINRNVAEGFAALNATDQTIAGNVDLISNNQNVTSESDLIKKDQSVGQNLTNVDTALHKEIAARIGADKEQDEVIKGVNDNLVSSVDTINKNIGTITDQLNKNDLAEAQARDAADQKLQGNITDIQNTLKDSSAVASADATKAATQAASDATTAAKNADDVANGLKDRVDLISNNQNVTSESDLIKKDQSVGQNLTNVDTALHKEIAARIGADKEQDEVIKGVNDNLVSSVDTINKNIGTITDQLNKNDLAEAKARDAADQKLQGNIDAEANARDVADQAEANARDVADQKLQGNIDAEANARDVADQAETKVRADKDTEHDTAIAANKKAIGDEAAARESGDNALQNQFKKESAARQADISRLDNKIHDVSKEVDTVGALSMAMSGLHPLSYDEGDARFQLSAAVGTYDGTEALALGGFYHFNRDSMLSVGVATDLGADEHRMGANVGYTRRIGQGGHVSRPSEGTVSDIMKDIKNLEQKQAKMEQENEQLKQQLAALKK